MIPTETLKQAREEAETGNDHYSRGFISEVITELLKAREEIERLDKHVIALSIVHECEILKK